MCAILKSDWMSKGDGSLGRNFEVITSNNHAKNLTGEKKYTKLGINLVNTSDKAVNKKVEEVSNSIQLSEFESKLSFNEMQKNSIKDYMKTQILTLRALGMSVKNMKKMIAFEALSYALLSFIIALIPSVANLTKFVNWNNNAYKNYGIDRFMTFALPVKESILFFIITDAGWLIAVMTSSRDLRKIYGKGDSEVKAIDKINLEIEPYKFTAIIGQSGSGKSSLLHCMQGLISQLIEKYLWMNWIYISKL